MLAAVLAGILSAVAIPRLACHAEKARLTETWSIRATAWKQVDVMIPEGQDAFQIKTFLKKETKGATLASRDFHYSAFDLRHISRTMRRAYMQARSRITPVKAEAERMNTNPSRPNRLWTRKTLEYQLERSDQRLRVNSFSYPLSRLKIQTYFGLNIATNQASKTNIQKMR